MQGYRNDLNPDTVFDGLDELVDEMQRLNELNVFDDEEVEDMTHANLEL